MRVLLSNKIVIQCTSSEWLYLEPKLLPYIIVDNKAYMHNMNLGFSNKDVPKEFSLAHRVNKGEQVTLTLPYGLWFYIKHIFKGEQLVYTQKNTQIPPDKIRKFSHLYSYQKTAVTRMLPFKNGILVAKTGSGKTDMGLGLALLKGKSVLWINDRIQLCRQARKIAMNRFGLTEDNCGLLQGDNEDVKPYTFTTIQKITKVLNSGFNDVTQKLRHFDVIMIDECHHAIGSYNDYKQYFQTLNEIDYTYCYGLTATVERPDGNEHLVHAVIGPVRYEVEQKTRTMKATRINKHCHIDTTEELYESFVNQFTMKAQPSKVDEYLLFHSQYMDFVEPYIDKIVAEYSRVLIVSPRVAGAKYVSEYLDNKGIEHFLVYGAIKKRERMYTDKVLVATLSLVKEGFDVPELEAVIVLARTPHKQICTQIIGRVERYVEGKKSPVAYFLVPHMKRFERKKKVVWEDLDLGKI